MQSTISKWGNSLALRLPRSIADQVRLVEGSTVEIEIDDGALRVTPSKPRFKLADLLEGETAKTRQGEVDWGASQGDEEW